MQACARRRAMEAASCRRPSAVTLLPIMKVLASAAMPRWRLLLFIEFAFRLLRSRCVQAVRRLFFRQCLFVIGLLSTALSLPSTPLFTGAAGLFVRRC